MAFALVNVTEASNAAAYVRHEMTGASAYWNGVSPERRVNVRETLHFA